MKYRSFLSSIAFRLPFAILFICVLVIGLALIAVYGLTKARTDMAAYGVTAFANLAKTSTTSRQISTLLSTAPFLLNTTSPYRLSSESLTIARQIDELMRYIRHQPPAVAAGLGDGDQSGKILELLATIRADTLALARHADDAQKYRSMTAADIALLDNERRNARIEPALGTELNQIALSAAAAETFIHLGETRRKFLKISAPVRSIPASASMDTGATDIIAIYDRLFEERKQYLAQLFAIRSTITRMRSSLRELVAVTEAQTVVTEQALSTGFASASQTLSSLRATILVALLLAMALGAFTIYSVIRVSRAITRISNGMHQLARGEKDAIAPHFDGRDTELRKLVEAFAAFRASVERVTSLRSTAATATRTIRSTFRSMNEGIAIFDRHGLPITMNHRITALLRLPPSARKLQARFFSGAIRELDPALLPHNEDAGSLRTPVVLRSRSVDGRVLEVSLSRQADERTVMLVRDVTEADRQEARERQAQRLDGIMRMTHQLSHEVGNMIGLITGSLGMLEKTGPLDGKQQRHVERIRKAAERGKALASSMLSVARQQTLAPVETDIGALLSGMQDILEIATGPRCRTRLDLQPSLSPVYLDPALFEQSILNLCLNAAAAMPNGGEIVIAAQERHDKVAVEVRDEGVGMAPDIVDRAFEPYFTTRTDQGGTGLGLAVVYGFVRQTGGQISIRSRPGEGTRVEMLFPIMGAESLAMPRLPVSGQAATSVGDHA